MAGALASTSLPMECNTAKATGPLKNVIVDKVNPFGTSNSVDKHRQIQTTVEKCN